MYFGKGHSNGSVGAQIDWKSLLKMLMKQMVNIFKKKKNPLFSKYCVKAKMSLGFALLLLMTCEFLTMFEKIADVAKSREGYYLMCAILFQSGEKKPLGNKTL